MKRRLALVEGPDGSASPKSSVTDWTKCIFCQTDTKEPLACPADYEDRNLARGYQTIEESLLALHAIESLPEEIGLLERLDCGKGIKSSFLDKKAKFHRKCNLRYNKKEVDRMTKRWEKKKIEEEMKVLESVGEEVPVSEPTTSGNLRAKRLKADVQESKKHQVCFFCDNKDPKMNKKPLSLVATLQVDQKVRECAKNLQDEDLTRKLSQGDMIAIDAMYHAGCLALLYKRNAKVCENREKDLSVKFTSAFAELMSFIESSLENEEVSPVFKLSELKHLYCRKIEELGGQTSSVHSTRLKSQILANFPELRAYGEGRDILIVLDEDVGRSIRQTCLLDSEAEAVILARAAKILRRVILQHHKPPFKGSFPVACQEKSAPSTLASFFSMVTHDPRFQNERSARRTQPCLTLAQLTSYHTFKDRNGVSAGKRHLRAQETPLLICLGSYVHSKVRSKEMINLLSNLGLSVPYDRVLTFSAELGNAAIAHFENIGAVVPPNLKLGVFTTSAVDNIDHNPSATHAESSFHGTGISLFQHPDIKSPGSNQLTDFNSKSTKTVLQLPANYSSVTPVLGGKLHTSPPPMLHATPFSNPMTETEITVTENSWCQHVLGVIKEIDVDDPSGISNGLSWAAFHGRNGEDEGSAMPAVSALLPLFKDDSKSVAMMRHAMGVIKKSTSITNPGQTPVITCDQPLFKLMKEIQWTWPDRFGEDRFVIVLGGLHIKMSLLKCLGNLLEGSGWTAALEEAQIASSGTADSFLKAAHVKKTLHAHHVTACALYILRNEAYAEHLDSGIECDSMEDWCLSQAENHPQFQYWNLILQTELDIFAWDRAVHEGDFEKYVSTFQNLQWLYHALDHQNYARCSAIHLRDMLTLKGNHPNVYKEFVEGKFTVNKTGRRFSCIPIDEAHEQNNAVVKGTGGAIGLTENPDALLRWMVCGPEVARTVEEFTTQIQESRNSQHTDHHDEEIGKQNKFVKRVQSLARAMREMGNPFLDSSSDLIVLDNRKIVASEVAESYKTLKSTGVTLSETFYKERIVHLEKPMDTPLKRNKVLLFYSKSRKTPSSDAKAKVKGLKKDRSLFLKLYVACQIRDGNIEEFFRHENDIYPPSLSDSGSLNSKGKADLLKCLEQAETQGDESINDPDFDMLIVDGPAMVHMIVPEKTDTFEEYSHKIIKYVSNQFQRPSVKRVDIVFDVYRSDSLKSGTREKRGKGTRRRVELAKKVPKNWADFLRDNQNKEELFHILAKQIVAVSFHGDVIVTYNDGVLRSPLNPSPYSLEELEPCSQEEADTRIVLHASHGVRQGYRNIRIRSVDTDVVALAIYYFTVLDCNFWVAFGAGKKYRIINIAALADALGAEKCKALLAFHGLSGCDTTSKFAGRGKATCMATWDSYPDVTRALCVLSQSPNPEDVDAVMPEIERFVVLLYDRCSDETEVNKCRLALFTHKNHDLDNIPPTQDALKQHVLRVAYQVGHIWGRALEKAPEVPDLRTFGWTPSDASQTLSHGNQCGSHFLRRAKRRENSLSANVKFLVPECVNA